MINEGQASYSFSSYESIGEEPWTKLFILGPLPCIEYPIEFGKGKIFFIKKGKEVAWFDLNTQMIKELGVKGDSLVSPLVVYKEGKPSN